MGLLYEKKRFITIDDRNSNEYKITIVRFPNKIGVFFGLKRYSETYIGSSTVWYKTGDLFLKRAEASMESFLCELWETYERKKR